MSDPDWNEKVDRVVQEIAKAISEAMDKMVTDLPEGAAPQMALEQVVAELAAHQSWFMRLIMEDADIREAYATAVGRLSLTLTARPMPGDQA